MSRPASRFNSLIKRTDKKKFYARFMVWSDSYETYLAARTITQKEGMAAGWIPYDKTWEYRVGVGRNEPHQRGMMALISGLGNRFIREIPAGDLRDIGIYRPFSVRTSSKVRNSRSWNRRRQSRSGARSARSQ